MKRLLIAICAMSLGACGSSSSSSSSGSTSTTTTSSSSTSGSGSSTGGSGSTSSGSGSTSTSAGSGSGSGSGGTTATPPPFQINTELYVKPAHDDAGAPLDSQVEYIATDLAATCSQLRSPDAGQPTTAFWALAAVTGSTDQVTTVPTGSYSWNFLAPPPDAGFLTEVQMALEYPDGGGHTYFGLSGTVVWTTLSTTEASGTYDSQLIDYDAYRATRTFVDAGHIAGSFNNVSYCGP